jgi:hypothetical protein
MSFSFTRGPLTDSYSTGSAPISLATSSVTAATVPVESSLKVYYRIFKMLLPLWSSNSDLRKRSGLRLYWDQAQLHVGNRISATHLSCFCRDNPQVRSIALDEYSLLVGKFHKLNTIWKCLSGWYIIIYNPTHSVSNWAVVSPSGL